MDHRRSLRDTTLILLLILITVNVPSVRAPVDWSPDMRITWAIGTDWYPSIAQAGDGKIWFVWHSYRTGEEEIFYKVYDPSKVNPWSSDVRLTSTAGKDMVPSVMQALDNRIWVIWSTNRSGNYEIFYKIYNGTWSCDTKLPADPAPKEQFPSILQAQNGTIWVFFTSGAKPNREISYKTSHDNGTTWSPDMLLTAISSPADDRDPAVTQASDGKIWLVWTKNDAIYCTVFDGSSWSAGELVATSPLFDWHPSIAQAADGKMWAVWDSNRDTLTDIYYSVYDGSWSPDAQLTTDPTQDDDMPSIIQAADGNLWVTWTSQRFDNRDIYYKTSSLPAQHDIAVFNVAPSKTVITQNKTLPIEVVAQNHGTESETFDIELYANTTLIGSEQDVNLPPGQLHPVVFNWDTASAALGAYTMMANVTVVAGETNTVDNTYVYGIVRVVVHDIAVIDVRPTSTIAYQTYYRVIYVDIKNEGTIEEDIVTVTTYYDSHVIGIQTVSLEPGVVLQLMFVLGTTSVPCGHYTISAEADPVQDETDFSDNLFTDGTLTVTIPGDVNGDGTINILDWSTISAHWYPGPPVGPLSYDLTADVNQDGAVNMVEIAILSAHWGQSW